MKLKINKACDLNSISAFPPPPRRLSISQPGNGGGQAPLLRSQPSQQSFSQGLSSQHGMLSQLSRNSRDDALPTDQRFSSEEIDHSAKRLSCLASASYAREEDQMPVSRASNSLMQKWSSNSSEDNACQISGGFERRMTMVETSVGRMGLILDSVQSDVMQANKGTKELSLQMEALRQKVTALDESIHLLNRGQEDIKTRLDGGLNSIADQHSKFALQDKSQQILHGIQALPEKIQGSLRTMKNDLSELLLSEMQAISCSLKTPNTNSTIPALKAKVTGQWSSQTLLLESDKKHTPVEISKEPVIPNVETGAWRSVKAEKRTLLGKSRKEQKHKRFSSVEQNKMQAQDKEWRFLIDSDEEIDEDCSIFRAKKETGSLTEAQFHIDSYSAKDAKRESGRILRKARRRQRRSTIVID